MLRCPETHEEAFLVMSTGEMVGRMVRSGILGCPICRREYAIVRGVVNFSGPGTGEGLPPRQKYAVAAGAPPRSPDAQTLQALLDLSGPGGYVVLVGSEARRLVVGADWAGDPWLGEAQRVLLRGRRLVIEAERVKPPSGVTQLAIGEGLWVGEKR